MPAFLAFLAEDTRVGERTARQYVAHLQRFAAWLEQHYQAALLEATTRDLRQYKTELGMRQKPASINATLAGLRRFFNWAADTERIVHNPAQQVTDVAAQSLVPKGFSDVERRRLIREAEKGGPMADAIVTLLLNTGLRVDELVTLTWRRIHVQARSGWIDVVGKGDKHRRLPLNAEARKATRIASATTRPDAWSSRSICPPWRRGWVTDDWIRCGSTVSRMKPHSSELPWRSRRAELTDARVNNSDPGLPVDHVALLTLLNDGQPRRMADLTNQIGDQFELTEGQRIEPLPSGQPRLANRVAWARTYTGRSGLLESVARGSVRITERGRGLLAEGPPGIDTRMLTRYPEFVVFRGRSMPAADLSVDQVAPSSETPDETIERADRQLRAALADELLCSREARTAALL